MFRFVSVIFRFIVRYYIILFQAQEPRKITGGPTGKDPEDIVLIGYPIHLPEIRPKTVGHFFKKCLDVSQNEVGKPSSGNIICHTWGRKTISGQSNPIAGQKGLDTPYEKY